MRRTRHIAGTALRHFVIRLVCAAILLFAVVTVAVAQSDELVGRLAAIRGDVVATEKVIAELKKDFSRFKKEEKQLATEIQRLGDEEQAMLDRITQVHRRKEKLSIELKTAEQRLKEEQSRIRERLRALYINSSTDGEQRALLMGAQVGQLERMAVYARSIRQHDKVRFSGVVAAVTELIAARSALDVALEEGKMLQDGVRAKRVELEDQRAKLGVVIEQIRDRQQSAKRSLAKLTAEANKLEELMRVILTEQDKPSTQEEPPNKLTPVGESDSSKENNKLDPRSETEGSVLHPGGLFAKTARLVYPVAGEVVQRFGKTKVTSFADVVFSKGYEYKTSEGSQVRAVLGGRVVFAGEMPGYDSVVIIDHGERSYSLYGRLGKSLVVRGTVVRRGDPIGATSTADTKGRNFYFETRKNGAPVDPGTVLTRAS